MVRADSPFYSLQELAGQRLAVNEFQSFSGYHMLCLEFGEENSLKDYFDHLILSGSHWRSLAMLKGGEAVCATIDSMLLDMLARWNIRAFRLVSAQTYDKIAALPIKM
jgi:ABC-type phosphate/phosphonate transport system substrate-binding protein